MRQFLTALLTGLLFSGPALADRPEAGAILGFSHMSNGGYSTGGWSLGLRGGYRIKGGLTPEGMLSTHSWSGGSQVLLGGGARYYFVKAKETIQPFALAHLQLATKTPSALGLLIGGGAQYRINKDFFAEGLASYHLTLGNALNIMTIGVGGGMKF